MSDTRLSMSVCCQGLSGGVLAQKQCWEEIWHLFTLSTNADFEHSSAEAISSWHTETLISGVVFGTHEDITGGCKSVCLDAFYLHIFHIGKVDRPEMSKEENKYYAPNSQKLVDTG